MGDLAIVQNTAELDRLEGIITRNLQSFYEVGRALAEIRDRGLYRDVLGFETFEAYCKKKWDLSRPRAYQLIEAAEIKNNLSTVVDIPERQLRPLSRLEPAQQNRIMARDYAEYSALKPKDPEPMKVVSLEEIKRVLQDDEGTPLGMPV